MNESNGPLRIVVKWVVAILIILLSVFGGIYLGFSLSDEKVEASKQVDYFYPTFPWPPPKASAQMLLSNDLLLGQSVSRTLDNVRNTISKALASCGYNQTGFYIATRYKDSLNGFALVTNLEQINSDAKREKGQEKANYGFFSDWSIKSYLRELLMADPGYYRVFVFLVTPYSFSPVDSVLNGNDIRKLATNGLQKLPEEIGELEFTNRYTCTVLIYEFEQPESRKDDLHLILQSHHSGYEHLEIAGIIDAFRRMH